MVDSKAEPFKDWLNLMSRRVALPARQNFDLGGSSQGPIHSVLEGSPFLRDRRDIPKPLSIQPQMQNAVVPGVDDVD